MNSNLMALIGKGVKQVALSYLRSPSSCSHTWGMRAQHTVAGHAGTTVKECAYRSGKLTLVACLIAELDSVGLNEMKLS